MAKAKVEKQVKVHLMMDEDEAKYIMGLVQNYFGTDGESEKSYNIRKNIFDALESAGVII